MSVPLSCRRIARIMRRRQWALDTFIGPVYRTCQQYYQSTRRLGHGSDKPRVLRVSARMSSCPLTTRKTQLKVPEGEPRRPRFSNRLHVPCLVHLPWDRTPAATFATVVPQLARLAVFGLYQEYASPLYGVRFTCKVQDTLQCLSRPLTDPSHLLDPRELYALTVPKRDTGRWHQLHDTISHNHRNAVRLNSPPQS
jgi:hypothetical protein